LEPVPRLLARVRAELSAEFDARKPIRVSRAPGRLDVMGGIADYSGSLLIQATSDCAAAVALQPRGDRLVQVFSFNLFDEHQPFTFGIPLDSLAKFSIETLRAEFAEPGRSWAAFPVGCLAVLHESNLIDLTDSKHLGVNLALYSTVPSGVGVGSSAALAVASMINLLDHLGIRSRVDPLRVAALCQAVQSRVGGVGSGIGAPITSCRGPSGSLLRIVCQPHEIQQPLNLPAGTRVLGINSNVKRNPNAAKYQKTRCATFMGHKMILGKMQEMGLAMGRPLWGDPMHGYLAKLDPEDYKKIFRPSLPENMSGQQFLDQFASTIDAETQVSPIEWYHVQHATDHHVLETRRIQHFAEFLEQSASAPGGERQKLLDKAGHLMYASHLSYSNDAMLGCDECDLLVQLVRERNRAGLYGARISGVGGGGVVAVLAEEGKSADAAIAQIMTVYEDRTGRKPQTIPSGSAGAWLVGTALG
jgi:L-arabinokinase